MNIENILSQLEAERDRLQDAISALKSLNSGSPNSAAGKSSARKAGRPGRRRGMSAAGRKRISDMMKARWAAHRKKAKKGRLAAA